MDGVSERALGGMDRHFAPHERICAEAGENKTKDCFDWLHFIPLAKTKQKNSAQKILNGVLYLFFWLMITHPVRTHWIGSFVNVYVNL